MSTATPLVSVIIPNYNYAHYLPAALDSVLAQTYGKLEIIVVDDGSTDDSLAVLRGYGDKITVIAQANAGVAAARNNGVAHSRGSYLAFLDADDIWKEHKIERQIARFLAGESIGLVHVGVDECDRDGNITNTRLDGMSGTVARELLLLQRPVILGGGSGFMVTKEAFDAAGGFDARLSTSADWEFWYRISSKYPVEFIAEPLIMYRSHNSNMHNNVAAMERDVTLGFAKAFAGDPPELRAIKQECHGNFYLMLAGSYYHAGNYPAFFRCALSSVWHDPRNLARLARRRGL